MNTSEPRETTAVVRDRVTAARSLQLLRQGQLNSRLDGRALRHQAALDRQSRALMGAAVTKLGLSVRGVTRVLRVARTIADLAGEAHVESHHVAEALQFRVPDATTRA